MYVSDSTLLLFSFFSFFLLSFLLLIVCADPLGMADGRILDSQITGSSELNPDLESVTNARLDRPASVGKFGGPATSDLDQWVQVDLGVSRLVTGIVIQGKDDDADVRFVKKYKVQHYSSDGDTWRFVKDSNDGIDVVSP